MSSPSTSLTPFARRVVALTVLALCCVGVAGTLALLGAVVYRVWQQSGAISGWLLAATLVPGTLVAVPSLRWLRVVRLFAGILLTICGTLLTLLLGYALENPTTADELLGGVMLATLVGFLGTLGADLRLQHLEARDAATLAEQSAARHRELLAVLGNQALATAASRRASSPRPSWIPGAILGVLLALSLGRRQRNGVRSDG